MIWIKYCLLFTVTLLFVSASDPFFGYDIISNPTLEIKSDVKEKSWQQNKFRHYLKDEENRVSEDFKIDQYYYPNVYFWFSIYTQYDSSSVVIHDRNNLSLVYKILDFSSMHAKKLPGNTVYVLQNKVSTEKVNKLKEDLKNLENNPFSLDLSAKRIYKMLKTAQVEVPILKADRVEFFVELRKNIRSQTGQKNFIRDGVMRSLPYQNFLSNYFEDKRLPKELLGIPFLESSFNPLAHSKANALGVWQFMPLIASYFIPKRTPTYDYRANVGISSIAASFLLAENKQILKSWDLAVTAYNSGTKHLLKTKRELASTSASLEDVIKHSDSSHFGFASKNFYSEFLALAHTLAYREEIFTDLHDHDRPDVNEKLKFFIAKCSLHLQKILKAEELDDISYHNHHLKILRAPIPRGFILSTKVMLPKKHFFQVEYKRLMKVRPKDWEKLMGNQSCSTR